MQSTVLERGQIYNVLESRTRYTFDVIGDTAAVAPTINVTADNAVLSGEFHIEYTGISREHAWVLDCIAFPGNTVVLHGWIPVRRIVAEKLIITDASGKDACCPEQVACTTLEIQNCKPIRISEPWAPEDEEEAAADTIRIINCVLPESLSELLFVPAFLGKLELRGCAGLRRIANDHKLHECSEMIIENCGQFKHPGNNITITKKLSMQNVPKVERMDNIHADKLDLLELRDVAFVPAYEPHLTEIREIQVENAVGVNLDYVDEVAIQNDNDQLLTLTEETAFDLAALQQDQTSYTIKTRTRGRQKRSVTGHVLWANAKIVFIQNVKFEEGARITLKDTETITLNSCDFGDKAVDEIFQFTGAVRSIKILQCSECFFTRAFDRKAEFITVSTHSIQVPIATKKLTLSNLSIDSDSLFRYYESDQKKYVFPGDLDILGPDFERPMAGIYVTGKLRVHLRSARRKSEMYVVPFKSVTCGSFDIIQNSESYICSGDLTALSTDRRDTCRLILCAGSASARGLSSHGKVDVFPELRCYHGFEEIMTPEKAQLDGIAKALRELRLRYQAEIADANLLPRMPQGVLKNLVEFMDEYPVDSGTDVSKNWIRCVRSVLMGSKLLEEANNVI